MVLAAPPPAPPAADPAKSQGSGQVASGADDTAHTAPRKPQDLSPQEIEEIKKECGEYCKSATPWGLSTCVNQCGNNILKCNKPEC